MVEPFDTIEVALMNCIHSNITGLTIGLWFAPHANGGRFWPCFIELATLPLVGFGMPDIVEVCYGDAGQSLIAGEFEQPPGTFTKLFGGGPGERAVQFIQLGQKASVRIRILRVKPLPALERGCSCPRLSQVLVNRLPESANSH